jgi:hypothetical protein
MRRRSPYFELREPSGELLATVAFSKMIPEDRNSGSLACHTMLSINYLIPITHLVQHRDDDFPQTLGHTEIKSTRDRNGAAKDG